MDNTRVAVRPATYVGLFLVTLAGLMLEIALTRIFSVTMWYHFAFVAISVALFGMTVGALIVHLLPGRFPPERVHRQLWVFSLLFAVSVAVCFAVQLQIPFTPKATLGGVASVVGTCVVISIPFVFSGVVVCLALTRFPDRVNRLYAVDLIGAGLGCVLLLVLFSWIDGPSLVVVVAALAAAGALSFSFADTSNKRGLGTCGLALLLLAGIAGSNAVLYAKGSPFIKIVWVKETRDIDHDYERWNAFSRLTVDGDVDNPSQSYLNLVIDSTAGTAIDRWDGDLDDTDHLRDRIQNLGHHLRSDADVFVVGVGGGNDVLSALEFEQRSVTGAEINGDIIDLVTNKYGDYSGNLDEQPGVKIVNDEARSYLSRTDDTYDILQISLIDTWAATAAGAFALSENSLYTTDSWHMFLEHLNDDGVLDVTRYYRTLDYNGTAIPPLETYRTIGLAAQVLTDRGVDDPGDHIVVYTQAVGLPGLDLATVLVSPSPFSADDRAALDEVADRLDYVPVLTDAGTDDPVIEALIQPGGPGAAYDMVDADITPPTDNRPFFFQMADIGTFLSGDITSDDHVTRPVFVLGMLAVTVVLLAAVCIGLPMLLVRRREGERPERRRVTPLYTYFLGIGLAFLLIEIAQLQRLSMFLGHPTYGLSVSLFSVLVFSGIGSMLTDRLVRNDNPKALLWPFAALLVVVIAAGFATVPILENFEGSTTPMRILVAVALLAPIALVMGMPFSLGMRAANRVPHAPTAFLWGINGAASVCASVLSVVVALFFGIASAFWFGATMYALAAVSMVVLARQATAAPVEESAGPGPAAGDDGDTDGDDPDGDESGGGSGELVGASS